jgi:cytochrome P450
MTDPPDHTRLRGLITPEFTKRRLFRLQPMIDEIVAESLDDLARLADRGPGVGRVVDLVPHFGFAVPFRVICDLLGLPEEDRTAFRHGLGTARFDLSSGFAGSFGAATESRTFMIDAVARQRRNPGDGLIGAILDSHGEEFDDVELGGLVDGVFLGGYETSASMLTMGAYVLMQRPTEWQTMQRGAPAEVDAIVEELLRLLCPVQIAFPRFARVPHDLGGHRIEKGAVVLVSLSGANRDPSLVPEPDDFSLRNPRTAHLTFGHGMHRCVGAELARMEVRAALTGLARRFPDIALASGAEPEFRQLSVVHSIDSLPVVLGSGATTPGATPTPGTPSRSPAARSDNPARPTSVEASQRRDSCRRP